MNMEDFNKDNYSNSTYTSNSDAFVPYDAPYSTATGTKCPGKEITTLVLGINALVWSIFELLFCWHIALAITYFIVAIVCGIVALVLHKKVHEQATIITKKVETGKKLAIAGIIISIIALLIAIVVIVVLIGAIGISGLSSYSLIGLMI